MEEELPEDAVDVPDVPDKPGEEADAHETLLVGGHGSAESGTGDEYADREAENDRPTVSPPFDPVAFARDVFKPSPQPMQAVRPRGPDAHTKATPAGGIEAPKSMPERRT